MERSGRSMVDESSTCGRVLDLKGCFDSRRTAWVIVGWKRPPWTEWSSRCVGRTWPSVKNVEVNLKTPVSLLHDFPVIRGAYLF